MREISRAYEIKIPKGKYVETFRETNPDTVYRHLAEDLIAKKLNGSSYIKSIKRTNNYDGTQEIIVQYNNDCRNVYTVEE